MAADVQSTGPDRDQDLTALESFVVDNDDLLALESLIGRFNVFDALAIARAEVRHSNFLAFILDPAESHGQGDLFLKAVLMDVLKSAPPALRPLSPILLDGTELRGVEVRREWVHIDLLITCDEPPFAVVVENKVDSHEHSDQLSRYQETMKSQYPEVPSLYVYLTPNGEEPSQTDWVPYSYSDLHRVLTRIRTAYQSAIGGDVLVFLDHYINLIGNRFMDDPRIDELCRRIYKNHRRALEVLFERVGNPASGVLAEVESQLRSDARWHVVSRSSNFIDFLPESWLKWLPPLGLRRDEPKAWFVLRFEAFTNKLDFYVEVRRMEDVGKRRQIVEALIKNGSRLGFKHRGGTITDNYTRVSGRDRVLKWDENGDEPEAEAIHAATRKKLDSVFAKIEAVPAILKGLV